jgi:hypothetical protein
VPAAGHLGAVPPAVIASWRARVGIAAPAAPVAVSTVLTGIRSPGRTSPNVCCWPRTASNDPRTSRNASLPSRTDRSARPAGKPQPPQSSAATSEPGTPHPAPPTRPILHAKRPCGTETSPPHPRKAPLHNPSPTPATHQCQQVSGTDRRSPSPTPHLVFSAEPLFSTPNPIRVDLIEQGVIPYLCWGPPVKVDPWFVLVVWPPAAGSRRNPETRAGRRSWLPRRRPSAAPVSPAATGARVSVCRRWNTR